MASQAPLTSRASLDHSTQHTGTHPEPTSECCRAKLLEAKFILQKLAGLSSTPTIALNEAAEFICQYLGVALVSIVGVVEGVDAHILFGSHGVGSVELERMPIMHGRQWASSATLENKPALLCNIHSPEDKLALPLDWAALHEAHGLCSFLGVPITTDRDICGVLAVAKREPDSFDIETWEPLLGVITVGLLHFMRQDHMRQLAHLLSQMDTATDHLTLISRFLHGTQRLLLTSTNIQTSCRLGLLSCDATQAMLFECEATTAAVKPPQAPLQRGAAVMANLPTDTDIQVTELPLQNTLLLDSVVKGKARFVSDCALYLQSCMKPAADIFISGSQMVASIVVLPLIHNHTAFGGVYFTLDTPSNFQHMKDLLLGFVNHTVLLLYKHLGEDLADVWHSIQKTSTSAAFDAATDSSTESSLPTNASNPSTISVSGDSHQAVARAAYKSRPPSRTAGIMKVLQNEIRKARAKYEWVEGLQLSEVIGRGGFGLVYRGLYKGSIAAVKVMYARQHERQAMKDALEMAVLTTVTHPNIIQVYDCLMDMVEDASDPATNSTSSSTPPPLTPAPPPPAVAGPGGSAAGARRFNVRFRKLQAGEDSSLATCNIVVMEFCDQGSLRVALKKGTFHRVVEGSMAVDLKMVVLVLIEVAQAIQHLHSMKLIHCDIKPENVLLKSDSTKTGLGFATKLSDFGLAKMLRENYYIVNRSGSGTVTHLAPELFQVGSKLTTGVDAFSFGIMMWEMYTGQRAYSGMGRDVIIDRVYKKKARPIFPVGAPVPYTALAADCWDNSPSSRPNFATVLTRLHAMLEIFTLYSDPTPVKQVPMQ